MASNYRIKYDRAQSNLPIRVDIAGEFGITTAGAPSTFVRPSAGTGATAGQGNLFTVTQEVNYNALGATTNVYRVTLTEQYLKPVRRTAEYNPTYSLVLTGVTTGIKCSTFDSTTNSFLIFLVAEATGAILTNVTTGTVNFEASFINTVSPPSL